MYLKKAAPLLNPSCDPCSNACFQTRPNGESGDDVARAMSFAMLSSVEGGGGDDAAAVFNVDTGAGGDTVGSAWLTGFFFNVRSLLFWHCNIWRMAVMSQGTVYGQWTWK